MRLAQIGAGLAIALVFGAVAGLMSPISALAYVGCTPGWAYNVTKVYGSVHHDSAPYFLNWNGTPSYATMEVTSESTGTLEVSASITGTVSAQAVVYGASLSTTLSLTASISWTAGNKMTFSVPPYRYGHAVYGAWEWKTYGHYYLVTTKCVVTNSTYFYTYVPEYAVGWRTWISTT
jgi:hypothetical protein